MSRSQEAVVTRRKRLQAARNALRSLTAKLPRDDGAYELLMGLGDATISDAAIDRQVVLSGTSVLKKYLNRRYLGTSEAILKIQNENVSLLEPRIISESFRISIPAS